MKPEDKFMVGDLVEVLNLTPEQAQYFSEPNIFIGMRYRIQKIWVANELTKHWTWPVIQLEGFPLNSNYSDTFFAFSQLAHYDKNGNKEQ